MGLTAGRRIALQTAALFTCSTLTIGTASAEPPRPDDASSTHRSLVAIAQSTERATEGVSMHSPALLTSHGIRDDAVTISRVGAHGSPTSSSPQNVLTTESTSVTTVAQRTRSGGRIVELLHDDDAPASYTYDLSLPIGAHLSEESNGGGLLVSRRVRNGANVTLDIIGRLEAPWAVDASGRELPVSYRVEGHQIVMDISLSGARYPVTADPTWTRSGFRVRWSTWNPTSARVYLNKARTDDALDGYMAVCAVLGLIPGLGVWLAIGCGAMAWLAKTTNHVTGTCISYSLSAFRPTHPRIRSYRRGFCR